jgi:hypothetical protein
MRDIDSTISQFCQHKLFIYYTSISSLILYQILFHNKSSNSIRNQVFSFAKFM